MPSQPASRPLRLLTTPLDALWRLCLSPWAALALAVAAALLIAVGLVLPQPPLGVSTDPQAFARWVADLQMQYGAWVTWPARVGLLTLYDATGFRIVWAMLGVGALVAAADELLGWRTRGGGRMVPWRALAHAGLLVILLGALIEERWGWAQETEVLAGARPAAVGVGEPALYLQHSGSESAASETVPILWRQQGRQGQAELQSGRPLAIGALTAHLQQAGMAVRLRLVDSEGQRIPLDDAAGGDRLLPEVTVRLLQVGDSRYVGVPARDWVVRVSYQPRATTDSPFALWVYRGLEATPLAQASLSDKGDLAIGQVRLSWEVMPYAVIRVARHPGLAQWIVGALLMGLGLAGGFVRQQAAKGRRRWLAPVAGLAGGLALWLAAGGPGMANANPVGSAALFPLGLAAALLLLGTVAGGLATLSRESGALAHWVNVPGPSALAWTVGGGLATLARWAAEGTLWRWDPQQARWAIVWCLLVGLWHARTSLPRRATVAGMAVCAGLALFVIIST